MEDEYADVAAGHKKAALAGEMSPINDSYASIDHTVRTLQSNASLIHPSTDVAP